MNTEPEPLPSTSQCILYLEKIENYLNQFDKEGATTESLNDIKRFLLSNRAKSCVQKKSLICLNKYCTNTLLFSLCFQLCANVI